jgi:hypothetical protein
VAQRKASNMHLIVFGDLFHWTLKRRLRDQQRGSLLVFEFRAKPHRRRDLGCVGSGRAVMQGSRTMGAFPVSDKESISTNAGYGLHLPPVDL